MGTLWAHMGAIGCIGLMVVYSPREWAPTITCGKSMEIRLIFMATQVCMHV